VGETEAERDSGTTLAVVGRQLRESLPEQGAADNIVVAYEPVWAIGTGRTPTLEQIADVHAEIRRVLTGLYADGANIRILYGGSVKPENAAEIFAIPDVDGGLIGGASLKAADFQGIIRAYGSRA
jgi:triosephosphate isomerase